MKKGILVVIALALIWYGFSMLNRVYWMDGAGEATITVERGMSLVEIEGQLVAHQVIDENDVWLFDLYARATNKDRGIKAGTFVLAPGDAIAKILGALSLSSSDEKTLTFIEGWDLRDIANYLEQQDITGDADELYEVTGAPARDYRTQTGAPEVTVTSIAALADKPEHVSLEGYLFPETYRVFSNATVDDVVNMLLAEFQKRIGVIEMRAERSAGKFYRDYTFFEVLTMASILEAEVRGEEDQRMVADIMWRRLENGWPLQVDSSVNYITEKDTPSASAQDIKVNSPYNTYAQRGLPLGPINNPSMVAFEAVINPQENEFWFFLTAPDGTVHYGRTIEEHAANRKFL